MNANDVNANDAVAFLVEVAVVGLLAVAGFRYDGSSVGAVALGVGLPAAAVVLWGAFAAPRARVQSGLLRLLVKLVVLGAGVVAGFVVLPAAWATVFAVVVAANLLLMYVGPFARRPGPPRASGEQPPARRAGRALVWQRATVGPGSGGGRSAAGDGRRSRSEPVLTTGRRELTTA
ncbi:MAG TPA: YrdB family protein [Actinomycetales bacterium]|nr:YrdB family protein [Actinomycetales bacterium]